MKNILKHFERSVPLSIAYIHQSYKYDVNIHALYTGVSVCFIKSAICDIVRPGQVSKLQHAVDEMVSWTNDKDSELNATKTKELCIQFGQES